MPDYEKSEFKKPEQINGYLKQQEEKQVSKEDFTNAFGEYDRYDLMSEKREEEGGIFRQEFEEKIPEKGSLKSRIKNAFKQGFHKKSAGFLSKGKRADAAKEKIRMQNHMIAERAALDERRKEAMEIARTGLTERHLKIANEVYQTPEAKEALRDWVVGDSISFGKDFAYSMNDTLVFEGYKVSYSRVLRDVDHYDLTDYEYDSDSDFISKFAQKYEQICRGASAEYFYNAHMKENGNEIAGISLTQVKAKIEIFKQLKSDYDNRMKLISSPYYALLGKSDLTPYLKEGGEARMEREVKDEGLKKYIRLFKQCNDSPLNMKKGEYQNYIESTMKRVGEDSAKEDIRRWKDDKAIIEETEDFCKDRPIDDEMGLLDGDFANESDRKAIELYVKRKTFLKNSYPADDEEFVRNNQIDSYGGKVHSIEDDEMAEFELRFLQAAKEGVIYGVKIKDEHLAQFREVVKNLMTVRRDYVAAGGSIRFSDKITNGDGYDKKNKTFMESQEGKELGEYLNIEMAGMTISNEFRRIKATYEEAWSSIYQLLNKYGYPMSQDRKYESRIEERMEEAVENVRKQKENSYYTDHPVKDNKDRKRIELDKTTVNGKDYVMFDTDDLIYKMAGKSYNISDDEAKEIIPLLDDYHHQLKRMNSATQNLAMHGGEKGMVYNGVILTLKDKLVEAENKLKPVLVDKAEQYEVK